MGQGDLQFLRGWRPAQGDQVEILDELGVRLPLPDKSGDTALRSGDGIGQDRTIHQIQGMRQADITAPLALAGLFSLRASEQVQEAALAHVGIGGPAWHHNLPAFRGAQNGPR